MSTFVDEAGRFQVPTETSVITDNFQCIVAVTINDEALAEFEELYGAKDKQFLREHWKDILALLDKHKCKAFAVIVDANLCVPSVIEEHKKDYIRSIYEAAQGHPSWLLETVRNHAERFSGIKKSPLYIKALMSIKLRENLLHGILSNSTHFLKNNDLKNIKMTYDAEAIGIIPTIRYFSLFSMYCNSTKNPVAIDNKDNVDDFCHSNAKYFDATAFFEDTAFVSSESSIGVRIADVVANQVFRNLNGKVVSSESELAQWQRLFSIEHSFDCVSFNKDEAFIETPISESGAIFAETCSSSSFQ